MIRTSRPDDVATTTTTNTSTSSTATTTESIGLDDVMQQLGYLTASIKGAYILCKMKNQYYLI